MNSVTIQRPYNLSQFRLNANHTPGVILICNHSVINIDPNLWYAKTVTDVLLQIYSLFLGGRDNG
jgi:hypothetical protein